MKVKLPPLHTSQENVRISPARFKVLSCGRRWGKSWLGSAMCVETGLKGGRAAWVAPTYKLGDIGWRAIAALSLQIPFAKIKRGSRQVFFGSSGYVEVRSAEAWERLKGEKYHLLVLDECAIIREQAWTESLRATLTDYQGSALFFSTPKGRNWFYRLWLLGKQGDNPEYQSWQLPTSDNPFIDPDEIEAAKADLPDAIFEQEYLAEFLIDEGAVFRNIEACLQAPLDPNPKDHQGHRVLAGVDWASSQDFTAISVGCLDCGAEIHRDRFNKVDYLLQAGRIKAIHDTWFIKGWLAESNAMGLPIIQSLQDQGIPVIGFQTTAQSKGQVIRALSLALERELFQFQDDPTWTTEMLVYEQKVSPITGHRTYNAPEGFHDDTVIARALLLKADEYVLSGDLFL